MSSVSWELDKGAVSVLHKLGVEWHQKTISATAIDVKLSRHNKARPSPLNTDTVTDYKESMEQGDTFPMICVAKVNGAIKYVIAGGNHRHQAAVACGEKEFPVMAFECDDFQYDVICRRLNGYVGQRESRTVRIQQAADLVDRRKMLVKEAAAHMGVSESSVSRVLCAMRAEESCVKFMVSTTGLDTGDFATLHPIRDDAALLPKAAQLLRMKMPDTEVAKHITAVRKMATEHHRVEALQGLIDVQKTISAPTRNMAKPEKTAIAKAITTLETRINNKGATLCSLQMTPDEATSFQKRLAEVAAIMESLIRG
jgi:hypothetical protein